MNIDSCSIRIDLRSIKDKNINYIWDKSTINDLNLILLNDTMTKDECTKYQEKLDGIFNKLWIERGSMSNLILIQNVNNGQNKSSNKHKPRLFSNFDTSFIKSQPMINQLTKKWNISHFDLKFDDSTCDEQNINEMLIYSIKYYWFSTAVFYGSGHYKF